MPVLELETVVKATPDLVWQVMADMGGLANAAPHVERVEILSQSSADAGEGLVRRIYDQRGNSWTETCVDWQHGKSFIMRVDSGAYPVAFSDMQYTWSLQTDGEFVRIVMRYEYRVSWGPLGATLDRWRFRPKLKQACLELLDNWKRMIQAREWAWRVTVARILETKGNEIFSVNSGARVQEVAALLNHQGIGCVLVMDGNAINGIVSERDLVAALADFGAEALSCPVVDVMTREVVVTRSADTMAAVMRCMNEQRIRHLPVVDDGIVTGLISIGDVVKARIEELEIESSQLRDFIETRRFNEMYRQIGPAAYAGEPG